MYSPHPNPSPHTPLHPLLQSYNYKFRLNLNVVSDTIFEDIRKFAKDKLKGNFIFSKEIGKTTEKPHIHGAFTYACADEATKRHLRTFIKFTNTQRLTNNDWSCVIDKEPATWSNYERYCCKENEVFCSSYSEDKIKEFNTEYWAKNEDIKRSQRAAINLNQKVKVQDRETHYLNILAKIKKDQSIQVKKQVYDVDPEYEADVPYKLDISLNYVMELVIEEYKDSFFTLSLLEPVVNRVMMYFNPVSWSLLLKDKLKEKLIPRNF